MEKAAVENAELIKGVLRLFEIASRLKANFSKSSIHGIRVDEQSILPITALLPFFL